MGRKWFLALLITILFWSAGITPTAAVTVYDTMQFGDTTSNRVSFFYGEDKYGLFSQPAHKFTSADTVSLDSILFRAKSSRSSEGTEAIIRIFNDAAGQPGILLEEWTTTIEFSGLEFMNYTLLSLLNPILQQGNDYWVSLCSTGGYNNGGGWRFADVTPSYDYVIKVALEGSEEPPNWYSWDLEPLQPVMVKVDGTLAVDDNTLPGNNVEVSDEETGITVTFGTVTAGGVTSVELVEIAEGPPPPAGFTIVPLGMYYDIDTTAEFSGLILIEIEYDDTGLTEGEETALKLKHYDEAAGIWEDKTTSVDIANNIIYGETNHLSFFAITMPRLVEIDIKPGSYPNSINPNAGGVITVAILTTDDFDASNVDPETVALDGEGARGKGKSGKFGSLEDVDGDGDLDLVVQIENVITWDLNATEAMLTGETYDGIFIEGTDSVRIVPPE